MKTQKHPGLKVLVCPLDWGLGHAARCIPLIQTLLDLECEVMIAADDAPAAMLRQEFPQLTHLQLPGYGIRYSKKASLLLLHLLGQLPKFLKRLRQEKQLIRQWTQEHKLDLIISDNRFRCLSTQAKSVYITHQLQIITSGKEIQQTITSKCASWWHKLYYRKFDRIWVPDVAEAPGLAGPMSHPQIQPKNLKYLGPLSRFQNESSAVINTEAKTNKDQPRSLIIILSGPEPQRSIWETQILQQFNQTDFSSVPPQQSKNSDSTSKASHDEQAVPWQITLLRGLPHHSAPPPESVIRPDATLRILNHAQSDELQSLLATASKILCRAGYSTLMDLIHFDTELYLVPTPGQPEQEFLARNLAHQGCAIHWSQDEFHLRQIFTEIPREKYNHQVFGKNHRKNQSHIGSTEPESEPTSTLQNIIANELSILF